MAWQFVIKLNMCLQDPGFVLSNIYLGRMKTCVHTRTYTEMCTEALFLKPKQKIETAQMSSKGSMVK